MGQRQRRCNQHIKLSHECDNKRKFPHELLRTPYRKLSKNLASLKTNAKKPTKQSKEGAFRYAMTAIFALEIPLSYFFDSF